MGALKYGKRPASFDPRDAQYAEFRTSLKAKGKLPEVPHIFGHGKTFSNWKMLGNGPSEPGDELPNNWVAAREGAGDCAWAGPGHEVMEIEATAHRPVARFNAHVILQQYAEYCGYDPQTGENDNGSSVRDVLKWRASKGLRDADGGVHKVGAFVALEPRNLQHVLEATFLFECVGIGFEVPESAEQQFAEGKPWSVVSGAEIVGGHYVPIVGRPALGELAAITWGRRQLLTEAFFERYVDESWAYITPERYQAVTGKTYEGFNDAQLEEYLHMV